MTQESLISKTSLKAILIIPYLHFISRKAFDCKHSLFQNILFISTIWTQVYVIYQSDINFSRFHVFKISSRRRRHDSALKSVSSTTFRLDHTSFSYTNILYHILYSIYICLMSVYTKSNKKSWPERGRVKFSPHAQRGWPRYINVVIKATFHVSVAFPIIFTLLLLQFKRIPPCMWYSREKNSNKHPLRGNRFKMSQSDSHPSCCWGLCHLCLKWTGKPCVRAHTQDLLCLTVWVHQENGWTPLCLKIKHGNN